MAIRTADFFSRALRTSDVVTAFVADRIFLPARPTIDEMEDNIPYVIITTDSISNIAMSKDNRIEGDEDRVTVSILVVAENHDKLMDLADAVRNRCVEYFEQGDDPQAPIDWQFTASGEMYDPDKPCNYLSMTYQCETYNF